MIPAVLDTNVLVSGLLSALGAPGRVLDFVFSGKIKPIFDDRILDEYERVLVYERFGFRPGHVRALLSFFELFGERCPADVFFDSEEWPDPDDIPFAEVACSARATLVSGNGRHYASLERFGVSVLSSTDFLGKFFGR